MQAPPALFAGVMLAATVQFAAAQSAATAKPQASRAPVTKPAPGVKPKLARSAQKAVEEATPVDDDPTVTLNEAELDIARQVFVGEMPCELGATVQVRPARRTGFFLVTTRGYRFLMHPHESRTGAIRLEDPRRGALWLQLGNKSMLMSQKLGRRLADECQSPEQVTFAEELKRNPRPSILEPMPGPRAMQGGPMHGGGLMGQVPSDPPAAQGEAAPAVPAPVPTATVEPTAVPAAPPPAQ